MAEPEGTDDTGRRGATGEIDRSFAKGFGYFVTELPEN